MVLCRVALLLLFVSVWLFLENHAASNRMSQGNANLDFSTALRTNS